MSKSNTFVIPEELGMRLSILLESNQMTKDIYEKFPNVLQIVNTYGVEIGSDQCSFMVMHLVKAVERMQKNQAVSKLQENVYEEVKESENFNKAKEVIDRIEETLEIKFSKNEKEYMELYFVQLFD